MKMFGLNRIFAVVFIFLLSPGAWAIDHSAEAAKHWAFQPLKAPQVPNAKGKSDIDRFVSAKLKEQTLGLSPEADRSSLIRRVAFTVTGLPPTPDEIEQFLADRKSGAYERMVERYLASPRYGEHWGKIWLDAAGYADSNGYFQADTDRPLAWRYRDYVIRSLNSDKPFDQFIREQLAGDEISGWTPGQPAMPETIELLEATHFLRNGQDGTGESDGNPDEVRTDRYYALESEMQMMGSCLLGLTVQCCKCHDHKFEPLTQKDYFAFQAILYPAFNIEKWTKPQDRIAQANLPGELETWKESEKKWDAEEAALKKDFTAWFASNRVAGKTLFKDGFEMSSMTEKWAGGISNAAVNLDSEKAPAAIIKDGALRVIESGASGDRWITTKENFDWSPATNGEWIQVTFDLVASHLEGGKYAERIAYFIARHDGDKKGGNILIDGNPGGATSVHIGYPGPGSKVAGEIGGAGYKAGHNYGVRVTRTKEKKFKLEHLFDGAVDGKSVDLKADDLPLGSFGFEYCCGRSFIVDNVVIEASNPGDTEWVKANEAFQKTLAERKKEFERETKEIAGKRTPKPGRIAWVSDLDAKPPEVHLLKRGNHKTPGALVEPAVPAFLKVGERGLQIEPRAKTTGRRLAFAQWLTEKDSRQCALLARVTVNRIWQNCFGVGIVSTPENLGLSGAKPTHPELLEWIANDFVNSGWSRKAVLRAILNSKTFRQASEANARGLAKDPDNRLLWRYPIHRLDAESIRDAMLATSGKLATKSSGPYVPTTRTSEGEIVVDESKPDGCARSIFLQQRRTQVPTFLAAFDAPSIVFNCTARPRTTMPLQSLSLLNSNFSARRAEDLADRVKRDAGDTFANRINRAFVLVTGRKPDATEFKFAQKFLADQQSIYKDEKNPEQRAFADFCQSLFASNAFLYLQ
ncbi:MAG TPA: DUF1549 and DUF1553 domain-containing protein [Verrucomicrobiae bacterium]